MSQSANSDHLAPLKTFGPSALATPANALTLARVLATPFFIYLIASQGATWLCASVGLVIAGTDGIDGYVARHMGATRSGAFLDPLADKVLVVAAMCTLSAQGHIAWVATALVGFRELSMSVYRSAVGRHGVSIPARRSAKLKSLMQNTAIGAYLVPPSAPEHAMQLALVWVAVGLTVITGLQYYFDGRRAVDAAVNEE
jgi:CDP-diacylglycerol--glycerol-3-phosphate 3-phosphatidyltransferase